jgi:peptide/nickel transport system ATP-binding protein
VRHISDRVMVMYLGKIVEVADSVATYSEPKHPYTKALLSAIPVPDPKVQRGRRLVELSGEIPSPLHPPSGCRFHTRCPFAVERCRIEVPELIADNAGHATACHRSAELPSADGVVPSDGSFSPALEKLVAAFSLSEEGPAGGGVDIQGRPATV